jgi:hypothetical protein
MLNRFMNKLNAQVEVLVFSISIAACGSAAQSAAMSVSLPTEVVVLSEPTQTPVPTMTITSAATNTPKPTRLAEIDLRITLPPGDPERGFQIAASSFGCYSCHANDNFPDSGPRFATSEELPFIMERGELRLALPEYEGKATNNMEYMIESIFLLEAYIVPGEWPDEMSPVYRLTMSDQDLADILAWIDTLEE